MAADTFSTDGVGVILMGTGNDNNTWGANANNFAFQVLVDAITNKLTSTVTGGTLDLSGSPPPATTSQARYSTLVFAGTLASNQIVQVPNLFKWWFVNNATVGAFTLKFKTPAGAVSAAIPQNSGTQIVFCDGANNFAIWPFNVNQIQMPDGSAAAPPYSSLNETNSGLRRAGTQDWRFVINGLDVLQITGAGAGTPSVVNILAPNVLQQAGIAIVPVGTEMSYPAPVGAGGAPPAGWLRSNGQTVNRTTFSALFNVLSLTSSCTTAAGNTTITLIPTDLRNLGLEGSVIEGGSIPLGTTIVSITVNTMVLSAAPGANASGVATRIMPWGQGDGAATFGLPDRRGRAMFGCDIDPQNGAANRVTFANSGIRGERLNGVGGLEVVTLITGNMPAHTHALSASGGTSSAGSHNHGALTGGDVNVHQHGFVSMGATGFSCSTPVGGTNSVPGWTSGPGATTFLQDHTHSISTDGAHSHTLTGATDSTGSGTAHQNMPPMSQTFWIIKT